MAAPDMRFGLSLPSLKKEGLDAIALLAIADGWSPENHTTPPAAAGTPPHERRGGRRPMAKGRVSPVS
jgi:hypothetical protein